MVYNWLLKLQGRLFPPLCRLCEDAGHEGLDICGPCRADLPLPGDCCPGCAAPVTARGGALLCGRCLSGRHHFYRCFAAYGYGPPLDYLVQRLKFNRDLAMARLLGQLFARRLTAMAPPLPDCILPVPLHRRRLVERGYNQALELAREVSRQLDCPVDYRLARRIRETGAQSLLPARERRANLHRAFRVRGGPVPDHVAILDDVMTTGTTVNELARALRRAGVKRVDVWVLARAGRD